MTIEVFPDGSLRIGDRRFRCALGGAGVTTAKREGDNATPAGTFPLRRVYYRADRVPPPETALPVTPLSTGDGWCDAPDDPRYNQPVRLPYPARHEKLWRDDHVYDVIVVLGYNDAPAEPGKGSAIFMHVARPGYAPTEGCVALALSDLQAVLATCGPDTRIKIHPPGHTPS
jgi:L,D-peptidoglycan transpeptidase YkuD (ErfK/YbiS/YcfS/YnhG family)